MTFEEIINELKSKFSEDIILSVNEKCTPKAINISADKLIGVCEELLHNKKLYFDFLSCITGLDNGPEVNSMEVIYNFYSIPYDHHLMIKVELNRQNPEIPTLSELYKTALWHEREAFDLLGIQFKDHPDLRRILLPADWEGYPLRKDYVHQEYYRNIKVEY